MEGGRGYNEKVQLWSTLAMEFFDTISCLGAFKRVIANISNLSICTAIPRGSPSVSENFLWDNVGASQGSTDKVETLKGNLEGRCVS